MYNNSVHLIDYFKIFGRGGLRKSKIIKDSKLLIRLELYHLLIFLQVIKDFTTQDGIKMKNGRFLFFQKKLHLVLSH